MLYKIATRKFVSTADKVTGGYSSRTLFPWLILDSEDSLNPDREFMWNYFLLLNERLSKKLEGLKNKDESLTLAEEVRIKEMLEEVLNNKKVWDETRVN